MTVRQRREVLETIRDHFVEYNLPKEITLHGYMALVANPVLRRAIKKNFRNWPRVIRALEISYPEIFTQQQPADQEPSKEETPKKGLDALAALKSTSVETEETNEDE